MKKTWLISTFLLANTVFSLNSAQAHGVWVAQRTGEWALVLGGGASDDEYKASAVKKAIALSKNNEDIPVDIRAEARNAVLETSPDAAALIVHFEDGYWSQNDKGKWVAGPKNKVAGATKGANYQMYTHTLLKPGFQAKAGVINQKDFPLQIIPQGDPLSKKPGDALRVQVLFQGKPLAGIRLAEDYANDTRNSSGKTDSKGYVTLRIRSAGVNVIKVSHAIDRTDRIEADKDSFTATLAFSYPHTH